MICFPCAAAPALTAYAFVYAYIYPHTQARRQARTKPKN